MKFYPSDWRADPALRSCSIAARGLWVEMLCIMHEAVPYGSLLIAGARIDKKRLSSLAGIPEKECTVLLLELEGFGVFSRDGDGTIYSRRMRRDAAKSEEGRKQIGKRWGDKPGRSPNRSPKAEAASEPITQKPETRSSEARASGADAPRDFRAELFGRGLETLSRITGKGKDACRSFVGKCLKAASDDAITVLGLIEDAERNQVIDPSAWIAARLKPTDIGHGKPKSAIIQAADDLCRKLASFDGPPREADGLRRDESKDSPRLLSHG